MGQAGAIAVQKYRRFIYVRLEAIRANAACLAMHPSIVVQLLSQQFFSKCRDVRMNSSNI